MITQSLIIRHTGGIIFLQAAAIQHVGKLFERLRGVYNSHDRVCVLWDYRNPVWCCHGGLIGGRTTTILDSMHYQRVQGGCSCHQCSVGVSFVGLCEPCETLALWLGYTQCYYGTWTQTLITQSSIIRRTRRLSSSMLHIFSMLTIFWKAGRGLQLTW